MSTTTIALQLPTAIYARLQALAAREHIEPVAVLDRLVAGEPQTLDGLIDRDPRLRGGRPIISGTGIMVRTVVSQYKLCGPLRNQRRTPSDTVAGVRGADVLPSPHRRD